MKSIMVRPAGICLMAVSLLVVSIPSHTKPIYKCQKDGSVIFMEEPCDKSSKPIELKGLAAPLKPFDVTMLKSMNITAKVGMIEGRIAHRQKRIFQYLSQMDKETVELQPDHDGKNGKSIKLTRSTMKSKLSEGESEGESEGMVVVSSNHAEQAKSILDHYKALIEVEQFYISVLLNHLHVLKVVEGTEVGTTD